MSSSEFEDKCIQKKRILSSKNLKKSNKYNLDYFTSQIVSARLNNEEY